MDFGHYNCRDYYITPHFAATTIIKDRSPFYRHESFDELEQRSRSPASLKPKFPLLKLPLELRQQIFSYLLPRTHEHTYPNPLANHARNFSAVKKRGERGMLIPKPDSHQGPSHIVWRRGNINLLSVCRQLHEECAELIYGCNTFLLFVTYSGITFRFSWLLPSGLAPNRRYSFLELLPRKYLAMIKRVFVNIDHVDSYTGMIKFNVSGKGLSHGLRKQIQHLVNALRQSDENDEREPESPDSKPSTGLSTGGRRLTKISVRVSNGSFVLDQIKSDAVRQREGFPKVSEDLQEMLEPFGGLRGVREVSFSGAITDQFARDLEHKMRSIPQPGCESPWVLVSQDLDEIPSPQLCVYGNDL